MQTEFKKSVIEKNVYLKWGLKFNQVNQYYTMHGIKVRMCEILPFGEKFRLSNTMPKSQVTAKWNPGITILPALLLYFGVYTLHKDKIGIKLFWIDNVDLEYG